MTRRSRWGKLIAFEGPDKVGKTTLARALSTRLNDAGVRCEYRSFPGERPRSLGHLVHRVHHDATGAGLDHISPVSLQVLHVAAHIEAIEEDILPALREGRWVVLDRFWWSTWVYGAASGIDERTLRAMIRLERIHWKRVKPSVVFLVERRGAFTRDQDEPGRVIHSAYKHMVDQEGSGVLIRTIRNDSSAADAVDAIWSALKVVLPPQTGAEAQGNPQRRHGQSSLPVCRRAPPSAFSSLSPAEPTILFDTYWSFAAERQEVFFRKLDGHPAPWTDDPILRQYKFTNAYRASDRVSQHLLRHVVYEGDQSPEEVFFRTILFKIFNKIGTWNRLRVELGEISYSNYTFDAYNEVLTSALANGHAIYSGAYIMPSGRRAFGHSRKHRNHLRLIERMMADRVAIRLARARTMREAFEILRSYPGIGDFLAYQYVTDLNYSELTDFSEMEFVVAGPGAVDGIHKCFSNLGGLNEADIIRIVADRQELEFELRGLEFRSIWGRRLQLVDCQNLFCEVAKYARLSHPEIKGVGNRSRIKQTYRPCGQRIQYWYPPKWGINHRIPNLGARHV